MRTAGRFNGDLMAAKTSKKWILAVLLVLVFPALAVHVSCVAVVGPGSWGSGMEEKAPRWISADTAVSPYIREFQNPQPGGPEVLPEAGAAVRGAIFWTDYFAPENQGVLATHEGQTWVEQQHVYLWRREPEGQADQPEQGQQGQPPEEPTQAEPARSGEDGPARGQEIRELDLPSEMILQRPTLMKRGGEAFLVVGRWLPWAISPVEKLKRYLNSYADPALRPEFSLYVQRLPSGPLEYWGPGHTLKPSPDRRYAILLRSGALGAGYYSVHLWDFEQDRLTTIVSLREADQGSGLTFDYKWSRDSRAVHITGTTGGFERRVIKPQSLDLIYLVGKEGLYDLNADSTSTGN